MHLLVMAKAPVSGRVKTRLCPPCTLAEAAMLAEAALADTLEAVAATGADRRIVALDGEPGVWLPPGFEIVAQQGHGLAARLAHAWAWAGGPGLQIGSDTPQVTPALLESSLARIEEPGTDAVIGPATDGGWWAIGFRRPVHDPFRGVPMSSPGTADAQRARLASLGLRTVDLPELADVDTFPTAVAVAGLAPTTRFAAALAVVGLPVPR